MPQCERRVCFGWFVLERGRGALTKHQRCSQEEHETTTDPSKHRGKTIHTPKAEGKILRPCGSCGFACSRRRSSESSECILPRGSGVCCARRSRFTRCGCHCAYSGGVHTNGVLGTTRVGRSTSTLASRVTLRTGIDTIGGSLGTFVVWYRLGILRGIGLLSVAAHAGVGQ